VRALLAVVLASAVLAGCGKPAELTGYVRTPLPHVGDVRLPDASAGGAEFALRADPGGILVVYFGYTSCPDVCPTTLAGLRDALAELGDAAAKVSVAMITVDPNRDTGEILTGYVQSFVPAAHALRTDDADLLRAAADAFGASYDVTVTADNYEVAHTAHLYAVDAAGDLRVTWPFGAEPAAIASDLRILLGSG
jgi:protein SCO1/2